MANDLMDVNKVTKTRRKAEEGGIVEHNDWTRDHNEYVVVRKPNGDCVEGDEVCKSCEDDMSDMMDW